ncbi:MAG: protein-disulfide reductase DsbD N-terminal domain-containing protein [Mucilaginibacter sp.]
MKRIGLLLGLLIVLNVAEAQILRPVHWSYGIKKTSQTEGVIFIKADIDKGWHIYSAFQKDGGPVKTSFTFVPSATYSLDGEVSEPQAVTKHEKAFEMDVHYFEKQVIFQQKIHLKAKQCLVKGSLKYMVCSDKQCLPPETVSFSGLLNE